MLTQVPLIIKKTEIMPGFDLLVHWGKCGCILFYTGGAEEIQKRCVW